MFPVRSPDQFGNLTKMLLCKDTSVQKLSRRSDISLSGDMSKIVAKCLSRNVEESFNEVLDPDPEEDDKSNQFIPDGQRTSVYSLVKIAV